MFKGVTQVALKKNIFHVMINIISLKENMMQLQESGEMYLETIYILSKKSKCVRSIDVVEYMGYSKPSVSRAVSILRENGYIDVGGDGGLCLTQKGYDVAVKMYERHTFLADFLIRLGVSEETATADACKMEHYISEETFEAIKKLAQKNL